ncbi:MAG TPA: phosphoribosylaminoimidazolecarboxamide formyltransferase [Trebonia sp.]|nr:phosphoribosylaminoimidazolecarboxamide formyltransferase [Trebonia sp.]
MPATSPRLELRGALNPHQGPAWVSPAADAWPFEVLNGNPSYTNLLDATHAWALARELDACTGLPAAVSFKHVNPSGAAVAAEITAAEAGALAVAGLELSPLATAYARARGANRLASYGDFVAVSRPVDRPTAEVLRKEVSDGIIAPGFGRSALDLLAGKKSGRYLVLSGDPAYVPPDEESRQEGGMILRQRRDGLDGGEILQLADPDGTLGASARQDLLIAAATAKWTVSNAVVLALNGQVIGVGAGQQSRIEATRIACAKAENWWLRRHPAVRGLPLRPGLSRPERDNAIDGYLRCDEMGAAEMGDPERVTWQRAFTAPPLPLTPADRAAWLAELRDVAMASDGVIPFRDNIDRAARTGVRYVLHSGGSLRDDEVAAAAAGHGITLLASGRRQFLH